MNPRPAESNNPASPPRMYSISLRCRRSPSQLAPIGSSSRTAGSRSSAAGSVSKKIRNPLRRRARRMPNPRGRHHLRSSCRPRGHCSARRRVDRQRRQLVSHDPSTLAIKRVPRQIGQCRSRIIDRRKKRRNDVVMLQQHRFRRRAGERKCGERDIRSCAEQ